MPRSVSNLKQSVEESRRQLEMLFRFVEDPTIQNALIEWMEMAQTTDPHEFMQDHGIKIPEQIKIGPAVDSCSNLCIGAWCPLHIHLPSGIIELGRCEDD
jgi:hypothetical protein